MKVMHIASFKGNVGDIVNHCGFYRLFQDLLGDALIDKIEIRDFYVSAASNEKKYFDLNFADRINGYDLLIIGGGGFMDLRWDYSTTGTTLDLSEEFISSVKTRVWINAIGYHEYPGQTSNEMYIKFKRFIKVISSKDNWLFTVRNDGSKERIVTRYGSEFRDKILKVPDNGFVYLCDKYETKEKTYITERTTVGMCITNELFSTSYNGEVTEKIFNIKIAALITKLISEGMNIVLFPHTPVDLETISTVMRNIPDKMRRERIVIAPYIAISESAVEILSSYYKMCDCIVGMRFHACILGLVNRKPTVALAGHEQIEALFEDMNLKEYCIKANDINFSTQLYSIIRKCLDNHNIYPDVKKTIAKHAGEYRRIVFDYMKDINKN